MAGGQLLRIGDTGPDVIVWQRIVNATADGVFGTETERRTRAWQTSHGLVADGVVGPKTWACALNLPPIPTAPKTRPDLRAPACLAALRDANARWPHRSYVSDGILGDARHQATKSDHNHGNAVDITARGERRFPETPFGKDLAEMAITDRRVHYVIWDHQIWNAYRAAECWRAYNGSNPHTHHVHISIHPNLRADDSPWPWAPADAV